jgi:ligand-binding sensor domain-containing protein
MNTRNFYFFVLFFLLAGIAPVNGQEVYFNKVIPPEGKVFGHVTGIVQDRHGYMWFATKKGLFRFDGYEMVSYRHDPLDSTTIASDQLESIAIDHKGMIWVGTLGAGLDRFDPSTKTFTHFRHDPKNKSSVSSDWIIALLVDRKGTLWVGGVGVGRFDEKSNSFIHYQHQPGDTNSLGSNEVTALYQDRQGNIWIGTGSVYGEHKDKPESGGLYRMDNTHQRFIGYKHDPKNPKSLINNKVRAIMEDSKGNFWVGTSGDGLHTMDRSSGNFQRHRFDPRKPEKLSRPKFKPKPYVDQIAFITEDAAGFIWIGTVESGMNRYDPATQKTIHFELQEERPGAFTDRTAWWAYTSREGVLWISTLFGNLYRINPLPWNVSFYPSAQGIVNSFFEDSDGKLWLGTANGLVAHDPKVIGPQKKYLHPNFDAYSYNNEGVGPMLEDRQGNLWVGTEVGLNKLEKGQTNFTSIRHHPTDSNSLSHDFILSLCQDKHENVWVGTFKGLNLMDNKTGRVKRFVFHPEDLGKNIVSSLLADKKGNIWVGCAMAGDVHKLNPYTGAFTTLLPGLGISSFLEDRDQILWVGGDDGLFRYDHATGRFVRYFDPVSKTEFSYVRSLIEDNEQNLWVATNHGISKLNRQRRLEMVFDQNFGISGINLCYGSCYKTNNGNLYFGAYSGYFVFYPDRLTKNFKPPHLVISEFRIANQSIQPGAASPLQHSLDSVKEIVLRHNQDNFSFDFATLDYTNPEQNKHLFMLEPYDRDWNQAGSDRRALYFNVPPGRYTFKVKGLNSFGMWTERSIDISITPPWWSTWWFKILAAVLVLGGLYSIIRWRLQLKYRNRIDRSEKEKQLAELRQRTTELEMQALRSQMNPHFIFNSLNAINRFILQNNKQQASEYLTRFSRLVRLILQNSQASLITLESELDSLRLYLELESLRFEKRFDFTIILDPEMDISVIRIPPLIIQPYVENAIWHGLMHKEEKGKLEIELSEREGMLNCRITDDGIGRKKAEELKATGTHKSMGLRITADRIALLQQQQRKASASIEVFDLVLPDGKPGGTEVIIKMPLQYD